MINPLVGCLSFASPCWNAGAYGERHAHGALVWLYCPAEVWLREPASFLFFSPRSGCRGQGAGRGGAGAGGGGGGLDQVSELLLIEWPQGMKIISHATTALKPRFPHSVPKN